MHCILNRNIRLLGLQNIVPNRLYRINVVAIMRHDTPFQWNFLLHARIQIRKLLKAAFIYHDFYNKSEFTSLPSWQCIL